MSKIIVVIETRIELPNDDNPVISVKNDRLISITGKLTEEAKDILWENEDIDIDRLIKERGSD
jgi:phosphoribosyl-ATP pyrophosphohydrolase